MIMNQLYMICAALSLGCLLGCAGPTSPFGALPLKHQKATQVADSGEDGDGADDDSDETIVAQITKPTITFTPRHQILHGKTQFSVRIEDPRGIPNGFDFMLIYNGI